MVGSAGAVSCLTVISASDLSAGVIPSSGSLGSGGLVSAVRLGAGAASSADCPWHGLAGTKHPAQSARHSCWPRRPSDELEGAPNVCWVGTNSWSDRMVRRAASVQPGPETDRLWRERRRPAPSTWCSIPRESAHRSGGQVLPMGAAMRPAAGAAPGSGRAASRGATSDLGRSRMRPAIDDVNPWPSTQPAVIVPLCPSTREAWR
jgi:hypothetical protein